MIPVLLACGVFLVVGFAIKNCDPDRARSLYYRRRGRHWE